jgi:RNA polymerase sigma-70 factor (ECF subfamily)
MITESGVQDDEERRQELLKALSVLKPEEMMLIELRFFEKRAFAEIGAILGMTENNAKVKTYRILDKLKIELMKTSLR